MSSRNSAPAKRLARMHRRLGDGPEASALAQRAKGGEVSALTNIHMRFFDRVYGYMRVALGDPRQAEEASQQVFLTMGEAISRYDVSRESFTRWLFRIAREHALARLRRVDSADREHVGANGWLSARTDGLRTLLWSSDAELMVRIERLPEAQRRALMLGHVLDFTTAEVAEAMGSREERVRDLQRRALCFLAAPASGVTSTR
jgi:RNA polymerase sigma factor (sigma-70 family)